MSAQDIEREHNHIGWWGLYDTVDKVWMGDLEGPITFKDYDIAQVAAMVAAGECGWPLNRVVAEIFIAPTPKMRDEVPKVRTNVLAKLERGTLV